MTLIFKLIKTLKSTSIKTKPISFIYSIKILYQIRKNYLKS